MSSEANTSEEVGISESQIIAIPLSVRFWVMLPFEILSIIFSLFILFHLFAHRVTRRALHNHVFAIILVINFIIQVTSIPWSLNYYRLGSVWPATTGFCLTWIFINEGLYITTTLLVAWASIERHILIFHDTWLATTKKIILLHVLPLVILLCYCLIFNVIIIIFPPCENTFNYSEDICGSPLCFYDDKAMNFWDVLIHDFIPTIIIISFSIGLIVRVVYKKHNIGLPVHWRKHRRMTIQLISLSLMYLIIYVPKMLLEFAHNCGLPEEYGGDLLPYLEFFENFGHFFLPVICTGSLPELQKKIKRMIPRLRRPVGIIEPETFEMSRKTKPSVHHLRSRKSVLAK